MAGKKPQRRGRKSGKQAERLGGLSLGNLADAYGKNKNVWPRKLVAEVAFALAVAFKRSSDSMGSGFKDKKDEYMDMAREYATHCVAILSKLPSRTLLEVAPDNTSLAGVTMPNYLDVSYITDSGRHPDFATLLAKPTVF